MPRRPGCRTAHWLGHFVHRNVAPDHVETAAAAIVLVAVATTPAFAADANHGKVVFQTCAACHSDKPDAIGPSLRGVYGRKSASLLDFRYSNAMTRANLTWDDANLKAYIKDSQAKATACRSAA
jgi:cytochrome c